MINFEKAKTIALTEFSKTWLGFGSTPAVSNEGRENEKFYSLALGDARWITDNDSAFRSDDDTLYLVNKITGEFVEMSIFAAEKEKLVFKEIEVVKQISADVVKGVPGSLEVERALSRLTILPNPNHLELKEPEKFVESPWPVIPSPRINPNAWDDAMIEVVDMDDLFGTDSFLRRKNVKEHIEAMGQATTPFRSFALIAVVAGRSVIIDGHHRLMALWLLGQNSAPAYVIEVE
jgi:hypothetical protein